MRCTIDRALSHPLISVDLLDRVAGIIKFRLGTIPTVITVRIVKRNSVGYALECSHMIKTAVQAAVYLPAFRDCEWPGTAVREFVRVLTQAYSFALKAGHPPQSRWLVANPYYELPREGE